MRQAAARLVDLLGLVDGWEGLPALRQVEDAYREIGTLQLLCEALVREAESEVGPGLSRFPWPDATREPVKMGSHSLHEVAADVSSPWFQRSVMIATDPG